MHTYTRGSAIQPLPVDSLSAGAEKNISLQVQRSVDEEPQGTHKFC